MTVYVDDMQAPLGRMKMCHMIADTEAELHIMVDRIGVRRTWFQGDHYDIALSKRAMAVQLGAKEITQRELGCMVALHRRGLPMGSPETAVARFRQLIRPAGKSVLSAGLEEMVRAQNERNNAE